ncbi:hypothetical protein F3D69_22445 [Bacteroides ovatus]|uniref:Uncharacterized protein n=1 Tax=Bacteroides ovatus TaxID=28116 RepID=A0A5M5EAC1_BACOV|nr:hypothetical protein [Bacteroides xylanisolvens]KAA4002156.1 hypothetical protein F3F37_28730 [Bacteroides ovatus]DAT09803.1 MAG TPA: hypothetical protein [Caudoviricetes sp.]KAA4002298.1 hypothetical protein F3D64_28120 [Bacteroides ovatus]KAA4016450.1 hypothetical protein F3D53_21305 [Bacteroides ovatus]KAA4022125.1 hypothetical protein F3D60_27155 [Bacteroides ovatus]
MKLFLKLIAVGEEAVSLLPFTRKLFIHRRYREKVKEEVERLKINIQWQILFDSVMILYCIRNAYTHCIGYGMEDGNISYKEVLFRCYTGK